MTPNTVKYDPISIKRGDGKALKIVHSNYYMERTQQVLSTQKILTQKLSMEDRLKIKNFIDEIVQE